LKLQLNSPHRGLSFIPQGTSSTNHAADKSERLINKDYKATPKGHSEGDFTAGGSHTVARRFSMRSRNSISV
jgi:hypothetical protein